MSEQPPSVAPRIASTTHVPVMSRISILDLNDIGPLLAHIQHVTDELLLVTGRHPYLGRRDLVLAHEEEVDVVCRQSVVERCLDQIAWPGRPHDARRHDD